jgi:hypothetical protein
MWPINRKGKKIEHWLDELVWRCSTLAKTSYVPLMKRFQQFAPISDEADLLKLWDDVVSIAMLGVYANSKELMTKEETRALVRSALERSIDDGGALFDDYCNFVTSSTVKINVSWSAASAAWIGRIFKDYGDHREASPNFKKAVDSLTFVNTLSLFMNIAFGPHENGFESFYYYMVESFPKDKKKIDYFPLIFKEYSENLAELISDRKDDKKTFQKPESNTNEVHRKCTKCGSHEFEHDNYWEEYVCQNCGWVNS